MNKRKRTISITLPGDDPAEIAKFERETGAVRIPLDPDPETVRQIRLQYLLKLRHRDRPLTIGELEELFDVSSDGTLRQRPGVGWPLRPRSTRPPRVAPSSPDRGSDER